MLRYPHETNVATLKMNVACSFETSQRTILLNVVQSRRTLLPLTVLKFRVLLPVF